MICRLEKTMNNEQSTCNVDEVVVRYLYLEVNAWLLNGVVYTNFNRALDARRNPNDVILQLYKQIKDPYTNHPKIEI